VWRALVPVVALVAGLLFAVSARTADGTDLRSSSTAGLADLVRATAQRTQELQHEATSLDAQVQARTASVAATNGGVLADQRRAEGLQDAGGLVAERGPGLTVVLGDSTRTPDPSIDANQYVIHQSDMQAVLNALWAGGAEAIAVSGQRIIATSSVRCVGSTVLVNGQLFSSPFRIDVIGPASDMQAALDRSYGVSLLRDAKQIIGVRFDVADADEVSVPAFVGAIDLEYAKVDG
jgi:uncharacterized protein YlxW (UPF0749 family)